MSNFLAVGEYYKCDLFRSILDDRGKRIVYVQKFVPLAVSSFPVSIDSVSQIAAATHTACISEGNEGSVVETLPVDAFCVRQGDN